MKGIVLSLLLSGIAVNSLTGGEAIKSHSPVVYAIKITGNRVTSEKLILREMSLKPGVTITPQLLEKDRLRLSSLGIFNRVEIRFTADKGRAVILVELSEPFYIYFFPTANYNISKPERSTWGFRGFHRNFRGVAARLRFSAWTGFNKGIFASHSDPWYSIGEGFSLSWMGYYANTELKASSGEIFRQELLRFGVTARRRLSDISNIGIGLFWEEQSSPADFYTISTSSRDRMIFTNLTYETNNQNYRFYPTAGYMIRLSVEANSMIDLEHVFYIERVDMRKYIQLGKIILAGRVWGESSQRQLPYYRRLSMSNMLIRSGDDFGTGGWMTIAANLECRFNIIPMRYISMDNIPIAGPYLHNMQFSTEGVLFLDAGLSRYRQEGVDIDQRFWAYGGGLHLQLPFVETVHLLLGWRPETKLSQPTYKIDAGVTF